MSKIDEFSSLINSMHKEEIRTAFRLLSLKVQEQIIGYLKYRGKVLPAISKARSFETLKDFGTGATIFATPDHFIPFPENKTLADMVAEPKKFHDWYEKEITPYTIGFKRWTKQT